jgi:hypothetical protein
MNQAYRFTDFGDLYRAAFAEPNPTIKQLLLAEVKKVLDRWAESMADGMPASGRLCLHRRRLELPGILSARRLTIDKKVIQQPHF